MVFIGVGLFIILALCDRAYIKEFNTYKYTIILYVLMVIINYNVICSIPYIKEMIKNCLFPTCSTIIVIVISMAISLITSLIFVQLLQRIHERKIISILENREKDKNYEYYRDIIHNISPGILYCCSNTKVKMNDIIIAILLDLKIKNIIKIEDENITVLKNKQSLLTYEKTILDYIDKKWNVNEFKNEIKNQLLKETQKQGYINKIDKKKMNTIYILELVMAWLIIYILIAIPIMATKSELVIFMIVAYRIVFLCIPFYRIIQSKINTKVKTEKGLEIATKLNGLKKFVKEFSNISKNGIDNILLFDEYVIYAILFNLPGKLNREALDLYKKFF